MLKCTHSVDGLFAVCLHQWIDAGCSSSSCAASCTTSCCIPARATETHIVDRASIKRIRTDIFPIQAKTSSWVNQVCTRKPLVLAIHYWETVAGSSDMKSGALPWVGSCIRHPSVADRSGGRAERGLKLYVYLRYDMKPSPTGPGPRS